MTIGDAFIQACNKEENKLFLDNLWIYKEPHLGFCEVPQET